LSGALQELIQRINSSASRSTNTTDAASCEEEGNRKEQSSRKGQRWTDRGMKSRGDKAHDVM